MYLLDYLLKKNTNKQWKYLKAFASHLNEITEKIQSQHIMSSRHNMGQDITLTICIKVKFSRHVYLSSLLYESDRWTSHAITECKLTFIPHTLPKKASMDDLEEQSAQGGHSYALQYGEPVSLSSTSTHYAGWAMCFMWSLTTFPSIPSMVSLPMPNTTEDILDCTWQMLANAI